MILRLGLVLALVWTASAAADTISAKPERVAVTIYRDRNLQAMRGEYAPPTAGLALVTETRVIDVPAGRSRISFRDVSDRIVPQTVTLEGLPAAVLERNTDYDLLSPGALLSKSLGRTVGLVRTDRATGRVTEQRAIVRATSAGIVLEVDGKMEALGCSTLPERLVFDDVPLSLTDRPTLSMIVEAPAAGRYTVRLSYLATGLSWSADYVARLSADGRTLDLAGWITLANASGTSFGDAPTSVVAGDLARDRDTRPISGTVATATRRCWADAEWDRPRPSAIEYRIAPSGVEEMVVTSSRREAPLAKQTDLGDYKLYSLPGPTTVAARQTKQVAFLRQPAVAVERLYMYRTVLQVLRNGSEIDVRPAVVLRLDNKARSGLGKPLPSGTVSVMESGPHGRAVLAGQHRLGDDVPVGSPLDLEIGRAIDLEVRPTILSERDLGGGLKAYGLEVEVTNAKPETVLVEYRHAGRDPGFKLVSSSRKAGAKGGDAIWTLRAPAQGRVMLRYEVAVED